MQPASIRYNNPGAMYPGPSANRFGSNSFGIIGGGHKIARFPDPISGAAAQFDLLRRNYAGMSLADLVRKWSGNNSAPQYAGFVASRLGVDPKTQITAQMLQDPNFAVKFAQAKSQWETGGKYPLDEEGWRKAHAMAYGGEPAPAAPQAAPQAATASFRAAQETGTDPQTQALATALAGNQTRDPVIAQLLKDWTYGAA